MQNHNGTEMAQAVNEGYPTSVAGCSLNGCAFSEGDKQEDLRLGAAGPAMLEFAMNRVHEAAFLIDSDSRFVYVNDEAIRVLGHGREELLRMCVADIDPDFPAVRWPSIWQELQNKGSLTFETRHRTKDGRIFPVEITACYFKYGGRDFSMALARDISERKAALERLHLLMSEVNHRAKNLLSVVQAVARQTAREGNPELFAEELSERIASLAATHDLLVNSEWRGVDVSELVTSQLAHFKDLIGSRVLLEGPLVMVNATAAQALGMALHELATNAGKYGALTGYGGSVSVTWNVIAREGRSFILSWSEKGGPPVRQPARQGFGYNVLLRMIQHALDADIVLDYRSDGLLWELDAPIAAVCD
ncbi:MAG: HWE histidine kinase domain-containing protein [Rhodomicrobium sp.]